MPVITVGSTEQRLAAANIMPSASRSAGRSETKAGAMTEISTQPGTLSITAIMRGLSVRFLSTT